MSGIDGVEVTRQPAQAQHGRTPAARRAPREWDVLGAIALGGFLGGLARYEIGLALPARPGTFPVAIFAINVSGSFLLALLMVFVLEVWRPTRYVRPLLGTGFCGAYTTFSTFTVAVDQLYAGGHAALAAGYVAASLAAGLAATGLGLTLGRLFAAPRERGRR
jgi:CrcB protein